MAETLEQRLRRHASEYAPGWTKILTEAADALAAMSWQPIETAPKDCYLDLWHRKGWRIPDADWDTAMGQWRHMRAGRLRHTPTEDFTHWCAIRLAPSPPAPLETSGDTLSRNSGPAAQNGG